MWQFSRFDIFFTDAIDKIVNIILVNNNRYISGSNACETHIRCLNRLLCNRVWCYLYNLKKDNSITFHSERIRSLFCWENKPHFDFRFLDEFYVANFFFLELEYSTEKENLFSFQTNLWKSANLMMTLWNIYSCLHDEIYIRILNEI